MICFEVSVQIYDGRVDGNDFPDKAGVRAYRRDRKFKYN